MMHLMQPGIVPYREAERLQQDLGVLRRRDEIVDTLILLEHPPVFTVGRRDSSGDLKVPLESLAPRGIEWVKTDRGGRITYHGPGQLVGYFICKLAGRTIPEFVREVEELVIGLLGQYGLAAGRDPTYPGVWIGDRKIAALGLHFEKGVSRHGFALNVNCDLAPFDLIVPCGIPDRGVTSMEKEWGRPISVSEVIRRLSQTLSEEKPLPHAPSRPGGFSGIFDTRPG